MSAQSVWKMKPTAAGNFEVPPEDNHLARLVAMIDLGTHSREYGGKIDDKRQVYLAWELLDCPMSGSKMNHVIGERYTASCNEKANFGKVAKVLLGRDWVDGNELDTDKMLSRACMVDVKHTTKGEGKETKTYASVAGIASVPNAIIKAGVGKPQRKPLLWSIGDDLDVLEKADWLPFCYGSKILDLVKASKELCHGGVKAGQHGGAVLEDPEEVDPFPPVERDGKGIPY